MSTPSHPDSPAPDSAAQQRDVLDWFVRRHREDWRDADEQAFRAWLAADPDHGRLYARWQAGWQALDALPAETVDAWRQESALQASARASMKPSADWVATRPISRRRWLVPALMGAAGIGIVGLVLRERGVPTEGALTRGPLFEQGFESQRGQQLAVSLPDGSRLRLDSGTRLQATFFADRRELRLLHGQAVFDVQPDPARPFHVAAGALRVTVVGTRFSVRHLPQRADGAGVRVQVEHGRVRVEPGAGLAVVELVAGQQFAGGAVVPLPADGIAPWREHRVSFVDTPLAEALAELERYGDTGLVVRDPAVAAMRLSGTFDLRDLRGVRRLLPAALPVRLQESAGTTEVRPALP